MYFLFKYWHERLFYLNRKDAKHIKSDLPIKMVEITEKNIDLAANLRGSEYVSQFEYQLSLGDFGYYAYVEGEPIGYGWAKHPGSDDFFYKIGEGTCYLCRFFVHESARGHNVYPEIISELIKRENNTNHFYIGVERGNVSSEKGLSKVGFEFVNEYGFIRGVRHTFNKKILIGGNNES